MAKHKAFSIATDMDVRFCDRGQAPGHAYATRIPMGCYASFPKGADLNVYGPEDLEHVAPELNARPPKTLDRDTPAEGLSDY